MVVKKRLEVKMPDIYIIGIGFAMGCLYGFFAKTIEVNFFKAKVKAKRFSNRWSALKEVTINFNQPDYEFVLPMHMRTIINKIIPEIIRVKTEQDNLQGIVIEKGKYDINFKLTVEWKKK